MSRTAGSGWTAANDRPNRAEVASDGGILRIDDEEADERGDWEGRSIVGYSPCQRLVRQVCTHCREGAPASPQLLEESGLDPAAHGETIFYECNLRGYTMRHPAIDEAQRGTFSGSGLRMHHAQCSISSV